MRNFLHAADETDHKKLVIAGGVSANALLRRRLTEECKRTGRTLYIPDLSLTGDNAAMFGAQAYYEYLAGHTDVYKRQLHGLHVRGIDLQRRVRHALQVDDGPFHHRGLVKLRQTHVHVQNVRAVFRLRNALTAQIFQIAFAQSLL